jgi:hypothetical protein
MTMNRRQVIKAAALAVAGAPMMSGAAMALEGEPSALRADLERQRDRIRTFHIKYTHIGDANDPLNGANELFYSGRAYHFRHLGAVRPLLMVVQPQETLTALGHPHQVQRSRTERTKRWPPAPSIDSFMPDLPLVVGPKERIRGKLSVAMAQGECRYWVDADVPAVVRRETFTTRGVLRLREEFSDFQLTKIGVPFPRLIGVVIFRRGTYVREATIAIDDVQVNEELDSSLFDINSYRVTTRIGA